MLEGLIATSAQAGKPFDVGMAERLIRSAPELAGVPSIRSYHIADLPRERWMSIMNTAAGHQEFVKTMRRWALRDKRALQDLSRG